MLQRLDRLSVSCERRSHAAMPLDCHTSPVAKWRPPRQSAINAPWPATIPKKIHIACADKRKGVGDCTQLHSSQAKPLAYWAQLNPDFEIVVHNDSSARHFLSITDAALLRAYEAIPAWAHRVRSDLWRVVYLLRFGGVYADADIEPVARVSEMIHAGDALVTSASMNRGFVNPHFIICRPGEPLLRAALASMLSRMRQTVPLYPKGKTPQALAAYNSWTVCYNLRSALLRRNVSWTNAGGVRDRTPGVRLLSEARVVTRRCPGCQLAGSDNRSATWSRKATIDPSDGRILLLNKYAHGADWSWRYSDSRRLREQICPAACL